ncbi:MAG TPA: ABC transporter substrate-binding protein [Polyangiaceae bacterium]|nr:ABC transporter substrate-binding protein [Polyangiaceae bacterium]
MSLILGCSILFLGACSKPAPPAEETKPATSEAPAATPAAAAPEAPKPTGPALTIAYSDWPGWVAWDIAEQKGWFKEAGVNVELKWFEYSPSMDAFSAGKVDAVSMTNGDALVTGSTGAPSVAIVINDFSNGNDMIIAKSGITSVEQLKGKKIGVEVGLVDHLLLLKALEAAKLSEKDVKIVPMKTDQAAQTLKSGAVDAVAAWQPNSGAALKEVPGSTAIYTSSNAPGLIYDVLAVNPKSLTERKADWAKVVKVWFRVASYIKDEQNIENSAKIMSARVGLTPDAYKKLMTGTAFQDLAGDLLHFKKGDTLDSIYGSSKIVDDFNVKNKVYKTPMKYEEYLDPSIVEEIGKSKS